MIARLCALLLVLSLAPVASAWADGEDPIVRGRHLLVYFGYTYCPDATPTGLQAIADVLEATPELAGQVGGLFVSVDPARDDAATLAVYAGAFHPRIAGTTAAPEALQRAAARLGARFVMPEPEPDGSYHPAHTTRIHLVSPEGAPLAAFAEGMPVAEMAAALRRHVHPSVQGTKQ